MQRLELDLDPTPDAPRKARHALRQLDVRLDEAVRADLELVVSELVSNAVVHGPKRAPVRLRLVFHEGKVLGEVADEGDGEEAKLEIRESHPEQPGGRGLKLVDDLCSRWGVYEGSTHVWFELGGG